MKNRQKMLAVLLLLIFILLVNGYKNSAKGQSRNPQDHTEIGNISATAGEHDDVGRKERETADIDMAKKTKAIEETRLPLSIELDVREIYQRPELPTGCESVALTMLLVYEGYDLDKTTIARHYLIYSETGDLDAGYVGDPFTESGAGCFPSTIVKTAERYLEEQKSDLAAVDLTGKDMEKLLHYVADGHPVAVWTTVDMELPHLIEEENSEVAWYNTEHCVVISGYDLERKTLTIQDPMEGPVKRDIEVFGNIYNSIGQYAVVLL